MTDSCLGHDNLENRPLHSSTWNQTQANAEGGHEQQQAQRRPTAVLTVPEQALVAVGFDSGEASIEG